MNLLIVKIIGAAILLSVVGTLTLSGLGKSIPDWSGDVVKIGIGALAGLVTGATIMNKENEDNA